jgi:hypothetical protein
LPTIPTVIEPVAPPPVAELAPGAADDVPVDGPASLDAEPLDGELLVQAAAARMTAAAPAKSLSQGFDRSGFSFMRIAPLACSDAAG